MANFLTLPIFQDIILPFILFFTLIFAILQKTKLLGDGKQQIDAIIAFVIAGIVVTFSQQVLWVRQFSVFLAVALLVYFAFMLIWAFAVGSTEGDPFKKFEGMKPFLGAIAFIAVAVAVLIITNTWGKIVTFFTEGEMGANVLMIVVVFGAIAAVFFGGKKEDKKKE
jgi:hypothetical protein